MCSFHYVSDISGYTEVLYHPKTVFSILFLLGCYQMYSNTAKGNISSPGYPANYEDDLKCTTTITVASGKRVLLNFTTFDLESERECQYDYLQIIDYALSSKFCGHPSRKLNLYLSKTNKLLLNFKTDSSVYSAGYFATFTEVDGMYSISHTHLTFHELFHKSCKEPYIIMIVISLFTVDKKIDHVNL